MTPKTEGTKPKELVIGRRYHIAGWNTGANFKLRGFTADGTLAVLEYPKSKREPIIISPEKLQNTWRHKDD